MPVLRPYLPRQTIVETGTAPVFKTVDTKTGPVAEAIKVHYDLNS